MTTEQHSPGPRYCAVIQLLRTADAVWNASRGFFEEWDLSPSQFNVLNLIYRRTTGLSQADLSRELIVHRSNVTGLVDRLEKRGLVERKDVAGDRRAYRVALTVGGTRLMERILPKYYAAAERVWERLPDKKVTELAALLAQAAGDAKNIVAGQQGIGTKHELKARFSHANQRRSSDPEHAIRPG